MQVRKCEVTESRGISSQNVKICKLENVRKDKLKNTKKRELIELPKVIV